ncbi:MAG: 1-deoxy-D-xylulose-5-phosphate reductoisomerase [Lachnospiraceae bacterium]|jgi:1-deoxy-D-xylulose-5-phosphate reductoisomerase|nr:1-deoxy-D-xylulose-5-phosphate reductoisomerase [Lachnospiraceae bacterium]
MKKIAVLGSTGSIGTQTLQVVRDSDELEIVALAAGSNITELEHQIREFHPLIAVLWKEEDAAQLRLRISDLSVKVLYGMEGLLEIAIMPQADLLVTAVVGMIGIRPTIAAIEAGKDIALANKETLVTAGHLIMPLARAKGVSILPVDSEHSAIFQSLQGENQKTISRILLTASGGPFRGKERAFLEKVTPADALKHPTWNMGRKITIDSATLVNKGLEVLEAGWLFGIPLHQVCVVVHPQSVIHSMVEYHDGAVIAQLGVPDMKLPISYALHYPNRKASATGQRLDFSHMANLTFEQPNTKLFSALTLAYEAGEIGGSMPTVYNAANEKAVNLFLEGKISFLQITELLNDAMNAFRTDRFFPDPNVAQILQTQQAVENYVEEVLL